MRNGRTAVVSTMIAITVVLLMSSSSAGGNLWSKFRGIKGSGDLETQERDVEPFDRISLRGGFDVEIEISDEYSLTLEFDDNLLDLISTEVRGRTLVLKSTESHRSRHDCKVYITAPSLERLTISGSGDVDIKDFKGESFECRISGSGNITASGEAKEVDVQISGSGDVNFRELKSEYARAKISGSGDVAVFASEEFDGRVSGSGDIYYYGNPAHKDTRVSGSGKIKRMR